MAIDISKLTPFELQVWEELQKYQGTYEPPYTREELWDELTKPSGQGSIESCLLDNRSPKVTAEVILEIF